MSSKLTPLQHEVLTAFFRHERGFFLTGGAALSEFYLHHRRSDDLDFFATDGATFERGRHVLGQVVADIGATMETVQDAPGFVRLVVRRGEEAVIVDLVHDRAPQMYPDKQELDGIRVDPIEEIIVNKITTVVSRAEPRDLVDLLFLERAGHRVEDYLEQARQKDGGCTPAALAWILSEIEIPDGAGIPGDVPASDLRTFIADLIERLGRFAFPTE